MQLVKPGQMFPSRRGTWRSGIKQMRRGRLTTLLWILTCAVGREQVSPWIHKTASIPVEGRKLGHARVIVLHNSLVGPRWQRELRLDGHGFIGQSRDGAVRHYPSLLDQLQLGSGGDGVWDRISRVAMACSSTSRNPSGLAGHLRPTAFLSSAGRASP